MFSKTSALTGAIAFAAALYFLGSTTAWAQGQGGGPGGGGGGATATDLECEECVELEELEANAVDSHLDHGDSLGACR